MVKRRQISDAWPTPIGPSRPDEARRSAVRGRWMMSLPLATVLGTATGSAAAQELRKELSLGLGMTVSDNVLLAQKGAEKSDILLRTAPTLRVSRSGGRLKFSVNYSPVVVGYVNQTVADTVVNNLLANSSVEIVDGRFFFDTRATVTRTFISPFAAQPSDQTTATNNFAEMRQFVLSPYLRGQLASGAKYVLRDDYTYTNFDTGQFPETTTNRMSARIEGAGGTLVTPSADYSYTTSAFGSQQAFQSHIGRLAASISTDPELVINLRAGYENNDYVTRVLAGSVYGGGFNWKPSPRFSVNAQAERRYYGNSVSFVATYQTRLFVFRLNASRSDQILQDRLNGTAAASTRDLLDAQLRASIPDATQRAQEVDRQMTTLGLSESTQIRTAFLSPRINLVKSIEPSIAVNGQRTSMVVTAYRRETVPLTANVSASAFDPFANLSAIRQNGIAVSASQKLAPDTTATVGLDRSRSVSEGALSVTTNQRTIRFGINRQISAFSSVGASVRSIRIDSSTVNDVTERAILLTFTHSFLR